jgi:mono/diheme cytochrome c family protein
VKLHTLRRCRYAAWFAFAAILLQVFVQELGYARAPGAGTSEIEICTSLGITKLPVDADGQAGDQRAFLDHREHHCVACHAAGGALPAAGACIGPAVRVALDLAPPALVAVAAPDPFLAWFILRKHGPPPPA